MEQQTQQACGNPIVVLAVDHSKHSDHAFECYTHDFHKPGNVLHVISVSEGWPHIHPMDGGPSPGHLQELKQKDQEQLDEMKNKYTRLMQEKQIAGEFHGIPSSHHKHIWNDIVAYQEKVGAIMIVIGTRGLGAIRRTVMGSVSDAVVHHAQCPVLVCRHS